MMYRYCACENTHPSALLCIDEPYVRNLKSTQLNSSILLCPIYFPPLSVVATGTYYPKLEFENHKNQYFSWLLRYEHVKTNIFGNRMTKIDHLILV